MGLRKKTETENELAVMSPEERSAIHDSEPASAVSSERLNSATALVSRVFNIPEGFSVTKFNDKGKVIEVSLDGDDFIVSVTIKNSEKHPGLMPT